MWRGGRQTVQKVLEAWFAVSLREHKDLFTHTSRLTTHAKETQLLNQKRTLMLKLSHEAIHTNDTTEATQMFTFVDTDLLTSRHKPPTNDTV